MARLDGLAERFDHLLDGFHDASHELTRQILQLTSLNEISEFAARLTDLDDMLDRVLVRAMRVVNAEIGSIMRLVAAGAELELVAAYGLAVDARVGSRVRVEDSLAREAIRTGQAVVVADITQDPRFERFHEPRYGSPSFLTLPLFARGEILGVINLSKKRDGGPFTDEDVRFLNAAFGQIGYALENARLYERVEEGYRELKALNQELRRHATDLEEQVRERTRELEEANRRLREEMARVAEADRVKSDFIASVSHEFRTPLNAILGFSSLILSGQEGEIPEQVRTDVEMVHQAGERLLRVVSAILDTSRIESGSFEVSRRPVPLTELLREVAEEAERLPRKEGVAFRAEIPPDLYLVSADREKLVNALLHLLENAFKFTSEGEVALTARQEAGHAVVQVSDTGIGIERQHLPFVFDKFWQHPSHRGMGGTGLGLALVKRIVELHEGEIQLTSEPGRGTTVTVTLPTL
ncbi:MAG: GAF domain-containing protein [Nitrospirae bacterium]|nr:MAG: GAF domain-containing protein [Nitrospirota bacterium]